jgi:Regulator of ribonuclease activity B
MVSANGGQHMALLKKIASALGLSRRKDASPISQDEWFGYVRNSEGGPWITVINETAFGKLGKVPMEYVAIQFQFKAAQLVNNVMPRPEMADVYYGLEDRIEASLTKLPIYHAASIVGGGFRKSWFCSQRAGLRALVQDLVQGFNEIPLQVIGASPDQLALLRPTGLERQLKGDENILRNQARHGDDGSVPREIMHWILRTPDEKRSALVSKLKSLGYKIEEDSDEKIRVSTISTLSIESANRETIRFNEICEEFGCDYDGWETAVIMN